MIMEGNRPLLIVASGGIAIVLAIVLNVVIPRWTDWTSVALRTPESQPQPAPAATAQVPPTELPAFDIIRLDRDGNVVVAGRGIPGSNVQLFAGDELLGQVTVDANGEWVFVPDHALTPGRYPLRLKQLGVADSASGSVAEVMLEVPQSPSGALAGSSLDQVASKTSVDSSSLVPGGETASSTSAPSASDVVVVPGHSLWRIARKTYGHGGNYTIIFDANRNQIRNPDLIYPGQVLTLP